MSYYLILFLAIFALFDSIRELSFVCQNSVVEVTGCILNRYLDIHISSTITAKMHSSAKYLESKLCHYMRPKCHPIFFDSVINSPGTVRLNIYQNFLLCAMKFHCYFRSMPDPGIMKPELLHIIKRTFRYQIIFSYL